MSCRWMQPPVSNQTPQLLCALALVLIVDSKAEWAAEFVCDTSSQGQESDASPVWFGHEKCGSFSIVEVCECTRLFALAFTSDSVRLSLKWWKLLFVFNVDLFCLVWTYQTGAILGHEWLKLDDSDMDLSTGSGGVWYVLIWIRHLKPVFLEHPIKAACVIWVKGFCCVRRDLFMIWSCEASAVLLCLFQVCSAISCCQPDWSPRPGVRALMRLLGKRKKKRERLWICCTDWEEKPPSHPLE